MQMEQNKRLDYIDCAKFFGIFILFVEHTGNFVSFPSGGYSQLKVWICSFHMALFFVVYGMVASKKIPATLKDWFFFVERKIRALLIPYLLWCMIYAVDFGTDFFKGVIWGTNLSLSAARTNAVLWFLPAMFCGCLMYGFSVAVEDCVTSSVRFKWAKSLLAIGEMLGAMVLSAWLGKTDFVDRGFPFSFDVALSALALMLIGRCIVLPLMTQIRKMKAVSMFVILCFCWFVGFIGAQYNAPDEPYPVTVMALSLYGKSYLAFFLIATVNTIGMLCLCQLVKNKLFVWLGKGSLVMMAGHYIVFPYTISLLKTMLAPYSGMAIYGLVFSGLNAILCMACFIPVLWLVNRYTPVLSGKS